MRRSTPVISVLVMIGLLGCGGATSSRADVVADMMQTAVPERFGELAQGADELVERVEEWCLSHDDGPTRDQVVQVREEWVALAPFWIGPVTDRRSRFVVDPSVRADEVQRLLDGSEDIDAVTLRQQYGVDQRGLAAVEVVLDGVEGAPTDRECGYTTALVQLVAEETRLLATDWVDFGPQQSADEGAANEALELIVNESLFAIDSMAREPASTDSIRLLGVRWALLGDGTEGSSGISDLLDDDVVERLGAEFTASESLTEEALVEVRRTITTNVASALGLSVQFSDADGDG
jgi:predicted lipoprotein